LAPENTLPAFARALSIGVTTLELDIGITRDGAVAIMHDRRLNPDVARDRDGNYVVEPTPALVELTLAQLKSYDIGRLRPGSRYAREFPDQLPVPGTHAPLLTELLELIRKSGNTRIRLNIETKISPLAPQDSADVETFATRLLGVLDQQGFTERAIIQSFDWRTLQRVQALAPRIPTAYLTLQSGRNPTIGTTAATPWTAGFAPAAEGRSVARTVKSAGGRIWSPFHRDIGPAEIAEAHGLGLEVIVWTVNDPARVAALIDDGVDGIISDRPDILRLVAAEKGLALPIPTPVEP
jgi:glycerophosphoryl diester phosphodiesterase